MATEGLDIVRARGVVSAAAASGRGVLLAIALPGDKAAMAEGLLVCLLGVNAAGVKGFAGEILAVGDAILW